MTKLKNISTTDYKQLALIIKDDFYIPVNTFKTTIFLCGADINDKSKLRFKIAQILNHYSYSYQYDLIYPEDIFDEILYSTQSKDLLSLEGILAKSVDAIIMIPESPGSFAELGAFANDEKLRLKLICVVDKKYKKHKSFINQGPLKLVKKVRKQGVLYIDPQNIDKPNEIRKLTSVLSKIKKDSNKINDVINLLQLENYLLPAIYLLEPALKDTLVKLIGHATTDAENSFQTTTTALTILAKKRYIELIDEHYVLTKQGKKEYLKLWYKGSRIKSRIDTVSFDNLRLEILNLYLRNKKLNIRGSSF